MSTQNIENNYFSTQELPPFASGARNNQQMRKNTSNNRFQKVNQISSKNLSLGSKLKSNRTEKSITHENNTQDNGSVNMGLTFGGDVGFGVETKKPIINNDTPKQEQD